jgi:hypothetical protein
MGTPDLHAVVGGFAMKTAPRLAFAFATAIAIAAFPSGSRAEVSINDSGVDLALDCNKDPEISMNGSSGTLTITGPCTKISVNGATNTVTIESALKVSVNGASNTVTIDAVDKVSSNGASNTITYKRAVTPKKKVKVSNNGIKNSIKRLK